METVNLFQLANQQSRWLSVRQAAIAGNIANVNTPGYGTVEVEPFQKVLDGTRVALTATQAGHIGNNAGDAAFSVRQEDGSKSLMPSQNSVQLEEELVKGGEVRRAFEINTAIVNLGTFLGAVCFFVGAYLLLPPKRVLRPVAG